MSQSLTTKISPAFEPFLADSGPNDKRDAIVIYRSPSAEPRLRGRLRELKQRMDQIAARAKGQQAAQDRLFDTYQRDGARLSSGQDLAAEPIGGAALPVASIEVTRRTLKALAAQDDVMAVLPDQRVRLIRPKSVDFAKLGAAERKSGLTWGLKHMEIPQLWERTRGEGINVAVLDTGVHGDHPALSGRVSSFIVVDPLSRRIVTDTSFDAGQHGTHVCGTIAGDRTPDGVAIGVAPGPTCWWAPCWSATPPSAP